MQTEGLLLHDDLYLKVLFLCADCQRGRQDFFRFKQNKQTPNPTPWRLHALHGSIFISLLALEEAIWENGQPYEATESCQKIWQARTRAIKVCFLFVQPFDFHLQINNDKPR